jgi:hypothetical protein
MDNYRLLHGRTSFNTSEGSRFLQGLYIDHDSIESKYKILKKNNMDKVKFTAMKDGTKEDYDLLSKL